METQSPQKSLRLRTIIMVGWVILVLALLIAAIGYIISRVSDRTMRMDGDSMAPALQKDDIVSLDNKAYANSVPQRGDIIAFDFPGDPNDDYVKRAIGLPGEEALIEN